MTFISSLNAFAERMFAGRWMAGAGVHNALEVTRNLNNRGILTIINYLGEGYTDQYKIDRTVDTYMRLIRYIEQTKADADVSVKMTQLGLLLGKDEAAKNYSEILAAARRAKVFIWVDMEDSAYVGDTIDIYASHMAGGMCGICIQAYLKRSEKDLLSLLKRGASIRLVKGAYTTSRNKGYTTKAEVTGNFAKLMSLLFGNGSSFTIATHDLTMIDMALRANKTARKAVTYAMLKGIRNGFAAELAKQGERVSVYVPFGQEWMPYAYRRLKEAGHLKLVLQSLFEKQVV